MPVSTAISGGMRAAGIDQRRELAEHLAAAHLDRADLGDRLGVGAAAGGLQVDHDEGDLPQRLVQLVESRLDVHRGGGVAHEANAMSGHRRNVVRTA